MHNTSMTSLMRGAVFCSVTLLVLGNLTSCDDNNLVSDGHDQHMDATGVALVMNGDTLVQVAGADPGNVVGEVELHEGEELGPIQVHFLDDDGHWFRPEVEPGSEHELDIATNELMVEKEISEWDFTLLGVEEGETALRVKILHDGHEDYVSPELPVHVHHTDDSHGPPVGMHWLIGDSTLISCHADGSQHGEFELAVGETVSFDVWFFDEDSVLFQPDDDHFMQLTEELGGILDLQIAGWSVLAEGLSAGQENLTLDVIHDSHSHYTSPEIQIDVH